MAAGDLFAKYGASTASIPVAGLASLPSSAALVAGWTSGIISNTTDLDPDKAIAAQITLGAGTLSAGEIRLWLYTRLLDGTWPDLFSAGTEGTEGAATVHSTQVRDMGMYFIGGGSIESGTPTNRVYTIPQSAILNRVGFMPHECALFFAHSTGQNLAASGHGIYLKGLSGAVAQS